MIIIIIIKAQKTKSTEVLLSTSLRRLAQRIKLLVPLALRIQLTYKLSKISPKRYTIWVILGHLSAQISSPSSNSSNSKNLRSRQWIAKTDKISSKKPMRTIDVPCKLIMVKKPQQRTHNARVGDSLCRYIIIIQRWLTTTSSLIFQLKSKTKISIHKWSKITT